MTRRSIPVNHFMLHPVAAWNGKGLLLTSGDFSAGKYNAMTVGWGSVGYMWRMPFVQVVVRPARYTFEFMEKYDTFTVCAFPKEYHQALSLLGTKSGRDGDKIAAAGLTLAASTCTAAPCYDQAQLVIECRKIYWQNMDPEHFLDPAIARIYHEKDYHRIYYGEILAVQGTDQYRT